MQFNIGSLALLAIAASPSLALPSSGNPAPPVVAFGQQLQNNDQTNHWVAWVDGDKACPGMQVLDVLTDKPCEKAFTLGEVVYTFSGCSGDAGAPTSILDSSDSPIGACSSDSNDKINCHDGLHDIIKHGTCVIANGA